MTRTLAGPSATRSMENNRAQLYISRLRVGTDGDGVRTLVSFTGCPLDCKWCINRELRRETPDGKWYTPQELVDELRRDHWYFVCTQGGVTFSGGEPLLRSAFIKEFCQLCDSDWRIDIETCLNVPRANLEEVLPFVSTFIVDIKDTNPTIYSRYTGKGVNDVMAAFDYLCDTGTGEYGCSVFVRVPLIPEFNTPEDVERSIETIRERYGDDFCIDRFEYVKDKTALPEPDGRRVCRVLKAIRKGLIKENGLGIVQPVCHHKGNCPGTCPSCEAELDELNRRMVDGCTPFWTMMDMDRYEKDLTFRPGMQRNDMELAGMPTPPRRLMGDVCIPEFNNNAYDDENL